MKTSMRSIAAKSLEMRLARLDEENEYFDGELGLRLNAARQQITERIQQAASEVSRDYLKLELELVNEQFEKLPEVYK